MNINYNAFHINKYKITAKFKLIKKSTDEYIEIYLLFKLNHIQYGTTKENIIIKAI